MEAVLAILKYFFWTPLIGWVMYLKRKDKEALEQLKEKVIKLETDYVNEKEVERIVDRILKPFEDNHSEIKHSLGILTNLVQQIKTDFAVSQAVNNYKDKEK